MDLFSWFTSSRSGYLGLLLLWIHLLHESYCHNHKDEERLSEGETANLYFTYADVAMSIVMVTEPNDSTVEYYVWKAGKTRNCVVNISSTELDKVVKVGELIHFKVFENNFLVFLISLLSYRSHHTKFTMLFRTTRCDTIL